MNKIELAIKIGEEVLEIPVVKSAVDVAEEAAQKLLKDAMPGVGDVVSLKSTFAQTSYRFVPARGLVKEVRPFSKTIMSESHTFSNTVFEPIKLPALLNDFQQSTIDISNVHFGKYGTKADTIH